MTDVTVIEFEKLYVGDLVWFTVGRVRHVCTVVDPTPPNNPHGDLVAIHESAIPVRREALTLIPRSDPRYAWKRVSVVTAQRRFDAGKPVFWWMSKRPYDESYTRFSPMPLMAPPGALPKYPVVSARTHFYVRRRRLHAAEEELRLEREVIETAIAYSRVTAHKNLDAAKDAAFALDCYRNRKNAKNVNKSK